MLGRVSPCLRGWCAALLIASVALVTSRASAEEEAVRVAYAAPASCPNEQVFVGRVRARTQHGRFAEPGELARTFDISLTSSPRDSGFAGQIEFIDVDGQNARRNVTGTTCDEVTSSLALIMALSIDDRVALTEARDNQSSALPPPAGASEPPKEATASLPARSSESPNKAAPAPLHLRWDVGVNAGVLTWVTPNAAFAFGAFAQFGSREHSWSVRLSGFDARETTDVRTGQRAHFAADFLRAELCPLALPVVSHVAVSPCVAFDGGVLNATGTGAGDRAAKYEARAVGVGGGAVAAWLGAQRPFDPGFGWRARCALHWPRFPGRKCRQHGDARVSSARARPGRKGRYRRAFSVID